MTELIIKSLITLIFAILTGIIVPYIKSKIDAEKFNTLKEFAEIAVRTAEQLFVDNVEKRKYVIEYLTQKCKDIGLALSDKDISNLLEYTVNLIKYGQEYTR